MKSWKLVDCKSLAVEQKVGHAFQIASVRLYIDVML